MTKTDFPHTFDGLMALVTHLRGPEGCPWDREQTARSMRRYVMEECHELVEAMDEGKAKEVAEELGDVVFHVAFQIRIWGDEGEFGESDVFGSVIEKLVRRHPHVFGGEKASGADQVLGTWQSLKAAERDASASIMDGVPSGMPALAYSQALQSRAAGVGFDWEEPAGVAEKVVEEVAELGAAADADERERELGDMLFLHSQPCTVAARRCRERPAGRGLQVPAAVRADGGDQPGAGPGVRQPIGGRQGRAMAGGQGVTCSSRPS